MSSDGAHVLLAFACVRAAAGAWSAGHLGIDRPGQPFETLAVLEALPSAEACFEACLARAGCESWTFMASCSADAATCILRKTVPPQQRAATVNCAVTSGVAMPARRESSSGLLPLQYEPLALGTVIPRGWLRDQLVTMANGLSGHLDG